MGVETPSRVGAGVARMWGVGPCGRPRGGRAHSPQGTAGSHKGPNPTPRRPCPYALHFIMAQNLLLRAGPLVGLRLIHLRSGQKNETHPLNQGCCILGNKKEPLAGMKRRSKFISTDERSIHESDNNFRSASSSQGRAVV